MKTTVRLTLDGLVRALRIKAHALADDAEQVYRPSPRMEADGAAEILTGPKLSMELADDRAGR